MSRQIYGQIAALEYLEPPALGFPDIVEEFDIAAQTLPARLRRLTWDGEDIALIDRETLRIALGWLPPEQPGSAHYLVIALGPNGRKRELAMDPKAYERLLRRVIERVDDYLPFDTELYGPATRPISSALIDKIFDLLNRHPVGRSRTRPRPEMARRTNQTFFHKGREHPEPDPQHERCAPPQDVDEARLVPPPTSVPMRLTIITFGLTLFLHAPPIGAGLLTYTFLREAEPLFS